MSDMKPFVFDSALVDPLDIARRDQMEFFIEKISYHRGKLSHRKSLQFFVSWMGYDQSYDSWEPYASFLLAREKSYLVDTFQISLSKSLS